MSSATNLYAALASQALSNQHDATMGLGQTLNRGLADSAAQRLASARFVAEMRARREAEALRMGLALGQQFGNMLMENQRLTAESREAEAGRNMRERLAGEELRARISEGAAERSSREGISQAERDSAERIAREQIEAGRWEGRNGPSVGEESDEAGLLKLRERLEGIPEEQRPAEAVLQRQTLGRWASGTNNPATLERIAAYTAELNARYPEAQAAPAATSQPTNAAPWTFRLGQGVREGVPTMARRVGGIPERVAGGAVNLVHGLTGQEPVAPRQWPPNLELPEDMVASWLAASRGGAYSDNPDLNQFGVTMAQTLPYLNTEPIPSEFSGKANFVPPAVLRLLLRQRELEQRQQRELEQRQRSASPAAPPSPSVPRDFPVDAGWPAGW